MGGLLGSGFVASGRAPAVDAAFSAIASFLEDLRRDMFHRFRV